MDHKNEDDASPRFYNLLFSSFAGKLVKALPSRQEFDKGVIGRGIKARPCLLPIPLSITSPGNRMFGSGMGESQNLEVFPLPKKAIKFLVFIFLPASFCPSLFDDFGCAFSRQLYSTTIA
jgi:hypothetical protein